MIIACGVAYYLQKNKEKISKELETILGSVLSIIVFGVFSAVFLAGALLFGDELRGGIPFLPNGVNNLIGRILFGLFGGIIAIMVMIKAKQLIILVVKWIKDKQ